MLNQTIMDETMPGIIPEVRSSIPISKPTIYLVGNKKRAQEIIQILSRLPMHKEWIPNVRKMLTRIDHRASAIVFIEPMLGVPRIIKTLKKASHLKNVPIHVITNNKCTDRRARQMYKQGALSVLSYPREASLIEGMITNLEEPQQYHIVKPSLTEKRFSTSIAERLKRIGNRFFNIKAHFESGLIRLKGRVRSRSQKRTIRRTLMSAPGVEQVDDDLLVVEENSDKNAVISAEIGLIVNKEFKEFEKNLVFSVNDGIVTLTGSVDTKATLDRLKDRILEVSGVDSVHNSVVMSHSRAESDREVAHRLETTLNKACKGAAISVNVMNHTVVLEGKVLEKSQARLAIALAKRYSHVKHVINNTVVKTLFGPHIPV